MRRHVIIAICIALSASLVPSRSDAGVDDYGWTLSDSSTDPFSSSGPANADTLTLYLWLYCAKPATGGVSTSRFEVITGVPLEFIDFTPSPGVVNSLGPNLTAVDLALPGCPTGSFLAGQFRVSTFFDSAYVLCLGPEEPMGITGTVGCSQPTRTGNAYLGYDAGTGEGPCTNDPLFFFGGFCIPATSVPSGTWGRTKALYRSQ